jgi:predicted ATPase
MVIECLKLWELKKYLQYSWITGEWDIKVDQIAACTSLADSAVEIVANRIQLLPDHVQDVLKVSACLWSRFHLSALFSVLKGIKTNEFSWIQKEKDLVDALNIAVEENLFENLKNGFYKFSHDRIQEGSYSLIQDGVERAKLHLALGKVIWSLLNENRSLNWMLFLATDQLNRGSLLIEDEETRVEVARLNLQTAQNAINMSSFVPAFNYLSNGIRLLDQNRWDKYYELTLRLYTHATEMASCMGDINSCVKFGTEALDHATSLTDTIPIYRSLINAYGDKAQYEKAMELAFVMMSKLSEPIPKKAHMGHLLIQLFKTMRLLKRKSNEDVMSLPRMTDETKSAAMLVLNKYCVHTLMAQKSTDMLCSYIHAVQLTLEYGLHRTSPVVICCYGIVLGSLGKLKEGIRFGELAMDLLVHLNAKEYEANVAQTYYAFLRHWNVPYSEIIDPLTAAYKCGMKYGDLEFAFYNASCAIISHYNAGLKLQPCESDCRLYVEQMRIYKKYNSLYLACSLWQFLLNLMGRSANPSIMTGEAMEESTFVQKLTQQKNIGALQCFWIYKGQLCYYFNDMKEARRILIEYGKTKDNLKLHLFTPIYVFFYGLVSLDLARSTNKRKHIRTAKKMIKIVEDWVKIGNVNFSHKLLLLKAELEALSQSDEKKVRQAYDRAIAAASRAGFLQDAALGNERAGLWFVNRSDDFWVKSYIERAYGLYSDWGAYGKAADLARRYQTVLLPDSTIMSAILLGQTDEDTGLPYTVTRDGVTAVAGTQPPPLDGLSQEPRLRHPRSSSTVFRGVQRFDGECAEQHKRISSDNYSMLSSEFG